MMTNYDLFFQEQMRDIQFANAYYEARIERLIDEMLTTLKEKIRHDESKENLLTMIDSIQQQMHVIGKKITTKTSQAQKAVPMS